MGRLSATKGAAGEKEVQEIFRAAGYDVRRDGTKTFGRVPDLYGLDGLHLEIKRSERLEIPAWFDQSERDASAFCDGAPTVIFRRNHEPWRIVLNLSDFLEGFYSKVYPRTLGR